MESTPLCFVDVLRLHLEKLDAELAWSYNHGRLTALPICEVGFSPGSLHFVPICARNGTNVKLEDGHPRSTVRDLDAMWRPSAGRVSSTSGFHVMQRV